MSIIHSPKIVTDGLIFYYDMHNTKKSWKGKPTENLISLTGSDASLERSGTSYPNYQVDITSQIISKWTAENNIVTISFDGKRDYFQGGTGGGNDGYPAGYVFFGDWSWAMAGGPSTYTYSYFSTTAAMPNPAGKNVYFAVYHMNAGNPGKSYSKNHQVEFNSYPTPFVNGTRTNTQTLLDLTGNNTLTVNSLTYASDNTFSFNGSNRVIASSKMNNNNSTWEAVFKCTEVVNTYNMFMGNYLPYFSFHDGNKLYFSNSVGGVQQTLESPAVLSINNWYHATFTTLQSGANTIASIYLNGKLVQSATQTGLQSTPISNFSIGDGQENSWYPFKGNISLVKVYNRALTESEVRQNFEATRSRYEI